MTRWLAAAVLLALAAPARAQDGEAALAATRGCLDAAQGAAAERACAGDYARACMAETPDGDTTTGMTACLVTETAAWDRLLNETFAALIVLSRQRAAVEEQAGVAPAPLDALLREAQRAWIAFRDADCAQEVAVWGEGSMRRIAGGACGLDRTATRVLELCAKRAAFEPR